MRELLPRNSPFVGSLRHAPQQAEEASVVFFQLLKSCPLAGAAGPTRSPPASTSPCQTSGHRLVDAALILAVSTHDVGTGRARAR